jgi:predicted nucleotidyltransferase
MTRSGNSSFQIDQVPARLRAAVVSIQHLQAVDRYQAAYIFGSVARSESTASSDLDAHVLIDHENACASINHPVINGVKLDLTFLSFQQLSTRTRREIENGTRVPMVAESVIVFDKTGALTRLRASAQDARPKSCTPADYRGIQSAVFHANDKAERLLTTDPAGALLVMHISLNDVLKTHYQIHGRWQVSDKRLLADLRDWDPTLAALVERLVGTTDVGAKFTVWTEAIDYVMGPIGGRQTIADANCACDACHLDLAMLANE